MDLICEVPATVTPLSFSSVSTTFIGPMVVASTKRMTLGAGQVWLLPSWHILSKLSSAVILPIKPLNRHNVV